MADGTEDATLRDRVERLVDAYWPLTLAVAVCLLYLKWFRSYPPPKRSDELLTAVMTIASISVGFIATAKSILLGMSSTRTMRMIREAGHMSRLVSHCMAAINLTMALAVLCAVLLVCDLSSCGSAYPWLAASWILVCAWATAASYRAMRVFASILRTESR